jgi:hypothetical protein
LDDGESYIASWAATKPKKKPGFLFAFGTQYLTVLAPFLPALLFAQSQRHLPNIFPMLCHLRIRTRHSQLQAQSIAQPTYLLLTYHPKPPSFFLLSQL